MPSPERTPPRVPPGEAARDPHDPLPRILARQGVIRPEELAALPPRLPVVLRLHAGVHATTRASHAPAFIAALAAEATPSPRLSVTEYRRARVWTGFDRALGVWVRDGVVEPCSRHPLDTRLPFQACCTQAWLAGLRIEELDDAERQEDAQQLPLL